jgi:hypothetical protein
VFGLSRSLALSTAFAAAVLLACDSEEHTLKVKNRTAHTLFIFGIAGETELTTGYSFVDPHSTKRANLSDGDPARIYVIFNHPRNPDGTPGDFVPGERQFSCSWVEAKALEPLVVTDGVPPCGDESLSPP